MADIAFLGTGLLGSAFVERALRRGERVTVWNRTASKVQTLEALGARAAATPADAVRGAARVHLVLSEDHVVEDVISRLRPGLGADAIIVDHSTTQPARTVERARRLNAEGVKYLHCPVFVGPAAAREGRGTILVSGPRALFALVQDALAQQAARVEYLGERPDLAAVYKLCGNAFIIGVAGLVSDMLTVASGAGVAPADALKLFEFFDPSGSIRGRAQKMAARDYTLSFELTMARKDLRLMIETAGGAPLAVLPCLAARADAVMKEGHGAEDLGVIGKDAVPP
jgi:3-hydroxyisobutyrate dehydrogenase-like beta-hydroxyacid dehydrogenase